MRLAYIASSVIPSQAANSIQVMKMCQAFSRAGAQVLLLARSGNSADVNVFQFYGVSELFRLRTLRRQRSLTFAAEAAWHALRYRPDVVYTRNVQAALLSLTLGLKVVLEMHHAPPARRMDRWMFDRAVAVHGRFNVVAISNALAQHLTQDSPQLQGRITVAHDGADAPVGTGSINAPAMTPDRTLRAGYVGHLYPGKGMELIESLVQRCSWVEFHIVGGRDRELALWKTRLAPNSNVIFHGFVPPSELDGLRGQMDVLLAPYARAVRIAGGRLDIAAWMSPLKVFEYMAARRPMIVSDLPVIREILTEDTAVLADPDDVDDWVRSLERLRDPMWRRELADNALTLLLQRYTWEQRASLIIDGIRRQGAPSDGKVGT